LTPCSFKATAWKFSPGELSIFCPDKRLFNGQIPKREVHDEQQKLRHGTVWKKTKWRPQKQNEQLP